MYTCKICDQKFDDGRKLGGHVSRAHKELAKKKEITQKKKSSTFKKSKYTRRRKHSDDSDDDDDSSYRLKIEV